MRGEHWSTVSLGGLVEANIGGLWGSPADSSDPKDTDVLVLRGADFRDWESRQALDAARRRVPTRLLDKRRLAVGDLVLEVSGGGPDQPVGRSVLIDDQTISASELPLICSNFCRKIRLRDGYDPHFIARQLSWLYRSGRTEAFQTASTNIRNLQVADFLVGTSIVLPDPAIQVELTSHLVRLEESAGRAQNHLKQARRAVSHFRRAVLTAACNGRLSAAWREEHPLESGNELVGQLTTEGSAPTWRTANAPQPAPDLPPSWGAAAFGILATNHDGRRIPVKAAARRQRQGPFPYYGASGIIDHVDGYLFDGDFLLVSEDGANLLARNAPIAFGATGRFWVNNHAHVVESKPGVDQEFLRIAVNAVNIQDFVTGSAQPKLTQAALNAMSIPVPSTAEQNEIVRQVQRLQRLADKLVQRIEGSGDQLDGAGRAILDRIFLTHARTSAIDESAAYVPQFEH
jgi:hypothetical protein